MKNRTVAAFLSLVFAAGLVGCDGAGSSSPAAPSNAQPTPTRPVAACSVANVKISGVVSEMTLTGRMPIVSARVFLDDQDGWTDSEGFFSFSPVSVCVPGQIVIWVGKDGYEDEAGQPVAPGVTDAGWRVVTIDGDTRLEITLVRR